MKIPTPQYIVFYNGDDKYMPEDVRYLRLSDAYEIPSKQPSLEVVTKMININEGHNKKLMEKCDMLFQYMTFETILKKCQKEEGVTFKEAVDRTIFFCENNNILKDILEHHRNEVVDMLYTEYNEKETMKRFFKDGFQDGLEQGKLQQLIDLCREDVIPIKLAATKAGLSIEEFKKLL